MIWLMDSVSSKDVGAELPRYPPSSPAARERKGVGGKVRGHNPPFLARSAGEEGGWGKVRAANRIPQHRR